MAADLGGHFSSPTPELESAASPTARATWQKVDAIRSYPGPSRSSDFPLVCAPSEAVRPMAEPDRASWFVYVIRLAERFTPDDRDAIIDHLVANGIGANRYFVPIHEQPHVAEALGTRRGQFPVTERVADRTVALPFFSNLTEQQVRRVADVLTEAIGKLG